MITTSDVNGWYQEWIPPVEASGARPRWSVMIPTYHCAIYLRSTLESVLSQDPGSDAMQIDVVDDCSTLDDPRAVVEEIGRGRVTFFRQPRNVGHVANFNTCLRRSRGDLVHILHGDDCVAPGFYATMQRIFDDHPEIGAAFCQHIVMDEAGHWIALAELEAHAGGPIADWLERIATGPRLQPPAMVVRRSVYEALGGFDRRITAYGEDWEMWVRIASRYTVWYEPTALALYRVRTHSLARQSTRTGANMHDMATVIDIIQGYVPLALRSDVVHTARTVGALGALRRAHRLLGAGDRLATFAQAREAVRFSRSPEVLLRAGYLSLRLVTSWFRPLARWVGMSSRADKPGWR